MESVYQNLLTTGREDIADMTLGAACGLVDMRLSFTNTRKVTACQDQELSNAGSEDKTADHKEKRVETVREGGKNSDGSTRSPIKRDYTADLPSLSYRAGLYAQKIKKQTKRIFGLLAIGDKKPVWVVAVLKKHNKR